MKIFDAENLDCSMQKIVDLCQELEETRDADVALEALVALSCMKLAVGHQVFDDLPAFKRWLSLANEIVTEKERKNHEV